MQTTSSNIKVNRPALRYYGGKWRLSDWIISHLPRHRVYLEPFGGGASVLLRKSISSIEVYNDLNSEVVNFFRVLREQPDRLIQQLALTPYSREEFERCAHPFGEIVEDARRFFVRSCQGRSFPGFSASNNSWRTQFRVHKESNVHKLCMIWNDDANLYSVANRLAHVYIEKRDAVSCIGDCDSKQTLIYVDPPYLQSTRSKYRYALDYSAADHQQLSGTLLRASSMIVLSGYRCDEYDEWYSGWKRIDKSAHTQAVNKSTIRSKMIESIWLNPAVQKQLPSLF